MTVFAFADFFDVAAADFLIAAFGVFFADDFLTFGLATTLILFFSCAGLRVFTTFFLASLVFFAFLASVPLVFAAVGALRFFASPAFLT